MKGTCSRMSWMMTATESITYLAGLSGDGTRNNAVMGIANKVLGAASVGVAAFFAWKLLHHYITVSTKGEDKFGGNKSKTLLNEAVAFMVVEGLLAGTWMLVNYGQGFVSGLL